MEDQRIRTMEALERRFAQAKAELQTQQQKGKKRSVADRERNDSKVESSPAERKTEKPYSNSSRKGSSSIPVPKPKQDAELNEPAYLKLSHSVNENLFKAGAEISDGRRSTVDQILHELRQHGDSAQKYMKGSKTKDIEGTILLDSHVRKGGMCGSSRTQALRKGSKRSKKHLSRKQQKRSGLFDLPKEVHNYEFFKPMHEMWKSYTLQLLKIVGKDQLALHFLNADLHGAIVLVVESKVASYVGIHGIMVRETKETFGIISQDNKFRVVPKKSSVFVLQVDCWKITLLGDKLAS